MAISLCPALSSARTFCAQGSANSPARLMKKSAINGDIFAVVSASTASRSPAPTLSCSAARLATSHSRTDWCTNENSPSESRTRSVRAPTSWAAVAASNCRSASLSRSWVNASLSSEGRTVRSTLGHIARATWVTASHRSSRERVGGAPLGRSLVTSCSSHRFRSNR